MLKSRLILYISECPEEYTGSKTIEMPENGGSIGRNPGCTLSLTDHNRFISSTHCLISVYGDSYYISDVSTNGTLVNGNRILKNQPITLQDSDTLTLGQYEVTAGFESITLHQDIAADLEPNRDSTDPLLNLAEQVVEQEESVGTIEDLFMETQNPSVDGQDPVTHLDFAMHVDDDYLIRDEAEPAPMAEQREKVETPRQIPDDSFSIHSEFYAPNLIPEDWMGTKQAKSKNADSAPAPEVNSYHPVNAAQSASDMSENTTIRVDSAQSPRSQVAADITSVGEVMASAQKQSEASTKTPRFTPDTSSVSDAFFDGLGLTDQQDLSQDTQFFRQMGLCLRLCINKLQRELQEVEKIKEQDDHDSLSANLIELMMQLNSQKLLNPNELIEQILDELEEHERHYHQAVSEVIHTQMNEYDPVAFKQKLASESAFMTSSKLWNRYASFYHQKRSEDPDSGSSLAERKIKEQYHKNLR